MHKQIQGKAARVHDGPKVSLILVWKEGQTLAPLPGFPDTKVSSVARLPFIGPLHLIVHKFHFSMDNCPTGLFVNLNKTCQYIFVGFSYYGGYEYSSKLIH